MHLERSPGEQVEVDWAGKTAFVRDPDTGKNLPAYLFVATLSYSQYTYVEAFYKRDLSAWINAHVRLFQFWGTFPKSLSPTILKRASPKRTGITHRSNATTRQWQNITTRLSCRHVPLHPRTSPMSKGMWATS